MLIILFYKKKSCILNVKIMKFRGYIVILNFGYFLILE